MRFVPKAPDVRSDETQLDARPTASSDLTSGVDGADSTVGTVSDVVSEVSSDASRVVVDSLRPRPKYAVHAILFLLTVVSLLVAGSPDGLFVEGSYSLANLWKGWPFALPLMSILLAHEFGHFIAARIHHVPASLPYFIPMPISPFGTMGAIIVMRGRIDSRKALLDIGASGPIAGIVVAIPILVWGLLHSSVHPITEHSLLEGQCILYSLIKRLTVGAIPGGSDVYLHPTAFAGWVGLLITMINLVPVGQLDGGHVAYALFGRRQNTIARVVHFGLLIVFACTFGYHFVSGCVRVPPSEAASKAFEMSVFWLFWFGFLFVFRYLSRGNHPPVKSGELGRRRVAIAVATLLLFILLFMPTPLSQN